jgi:hypothetical protein
MARTVPCPVTEQDCEKDDCTVRFCVLAASARAAVGIEAARQRAAEEAEAERFKWRRDRTARRWVRRVSARDLPDL